MVYLGSPYLALTVSILPVSLTLFSQASVNIHYKGGGARRQCPYLSEAESSLMPQEITPATGAPLSSSPTWSSDNNNNNGNGTKFISTDGTASIKDATRLADLGYRPELKRNFSALETFGVAFSIM